MYNEKHVTVMPKKDYYRKTSPNKAWDCFLCGELVGSIEYIQDRHERRKPYESLVCDMGGRMRFVSWHDSLYEARVALIEPAREYLRNKDENSPAYETPVAALPESDFQFFPTPPEIAGKLMSAVDWNRVETILEPSAGRGDLLEYAIRRNGHRQGCDIDCVEIDPNLRALLTGKGFSRAARKTDVEVALVNISMPVANTDTSIWDDLKKAQETPLENTSLNEVAPANQIDRLIREYDLLCEAGIALMVSGSLQAEQNGRGQDFL